MMFLFHFGWKIVLSRHFGMTFFSVTFLQTRHHRCTIALHCKEAIRDAIPQIPGFDPQRKISIERASRTDRFFCCKKTLLKKTHFLKGKSYIHSLKLTWHLKIGHPKRKLVFQPSIFMCYVSFREGTVYLDLYLKRKVPQEWIFMVTGYLSTRDFFHLLEDIRLIDTLPKPAGSKDTFKSWWKKSGSPVDMVNLPLIFKVFIYIPGGKNISKMTPWNPHPTSVRKKPDPRCSCQSKGNMNSASLASSIFLQKKTSRARHAKKMW